MEYNIYIVGLGGQGVLTIGELIADSTQKSGAHVNYFPTKGMSQRGGFVNAQLRIGDDLGPALPPEGAQLVIAFERSEALKGIRYCNPETDFVLFDDCWMTSQVIVGKAAYPDEELVLSEIRKSCRSFLRISPDALPEYDGVRGRSNVFVMGVLMQKTGLRDILDASAVEACVKAMKNPAFNMKVFAAGKALFAE